MGRGPALTLPSVLRGPLHDLGALAGLVRPAPGGTLRLGLAIAFLLWLVLVALAALDGLLDKLLSLGVVAGHVRLLVAIPLLFALEGVLELSLGRFVHGLVASEIAQGSTATALRQACDRFNRSTGSRMAEAAILIAAVAPSWLAVDIVFLGATSVQSARADAPLAGYWYWFVCLPAFRFVLLRSVFRLVVWYAFLWQLSRLDLKLYPSHPDRVGGLRFVSEVQVSFAYMAAAASAILAGGIAEEIVTTGIGLQTHYGTMLVTLLGSGVAFLAPLLVFSCQLWNVRMRGLAEYGDLGSIYAAGFDAKWIRGGAPRSDLLGTSDLQSLADLANSVRVVEDMQLSPVTRDLVVQIALACVIPMIPLLLFEFPLHEIVSRILEKLIGA